MFGDVMQVEVGEIQARVNGIIKLKEAGFTFEEISKLFTGAINGTT